MKIQNAVLNLTMIALMLAGCANPKVANTVPTPSPVAQNQKMDELIPIEKLNARVEPEPTQTSVVRKGMDLKGEGKAAAIKVRLAQREQIRVVNKAPRENRAEGVSLLKESNIGRCMVMPPSMSASPPFHTEEYDEINENIFHEAANDNLSTFSIDVDGASYANARRFLTGNQLPPMDAVRIEEFVNYFSYNYPEPTGKDPFSITTDVGSAPWAPDHRLVLIGLKGWSIENKNAPASNLVFLIDTSGSMQDANKLPLLKSSLRLLVNELRAKDRVSIVTYAGSAGLVLPPTPGNQKDKILAALENLEAGGSTAGGAGIELAYKTAIQTEFSRGNNRVILATDGDFNVGTSSDAELVRMIEEKRKAGIFLTVLGFGMGNYKDSKMEKLADKGNGNYAYIDSMLEARKVLVSQMGGTLHTIAKDVKLQVEFNPAQVKAYRLIGYENRALRNEDFNDDRKDAGELGAGHTVTALYEIIPAGSPEKTAGVDPLKYVKKFVTRETLESKEMLTVKFRYKAPTEDKSQLLAKVLVDTGADLDGASENLRFAAAVAGFGMVLRNSEFKGTFTCAKAAELAKRSMGEDEEGYRAEFIRLVRAAEALLPTREARK